MIMTNQDRNKGIIRQESGLVSIIVVVIFMVIITTITLSFSSVVRNEQRQSLDRQLNTQAQYAAESGINYAKKIIESQIAVSPNASLAPLAKNGCPAAAPYTDALQYEDGVTTSCLLVDTNPRTLVYDLSPANQSKVFPVRPILGPTDTVNTVVLEWVPQSGNPDNCPNSATLGNLDKSADWKCPYGVIRVDLADTTIGFAASDTRDALAKNTFAGIFMPTKPGTSGGTVNFAAGRNAFSGANGTASQGVRLPATCDSNRCKMTISLPVSDHQYYMRISALYRDAKISVSMPNTAGVKVGLKDAQVLVDATGKAQDVLKRIQVRIPLSGNGTHSDYGLQARDSVCKNFIVFPGYTSSSPSCTP